MPGLTGVPETGICGGGGEEGGLPVKGGGDPDNETKIIGHQVQETSS